MSSPHQMYIITIHLLTSIKYWRDNTLQSQYDAYTLARNSAYITTRTNKPKSFKHGSVYDKKMLVFGLGHRFFQSYKKSQKNYLSPNLNFMIMIVSFTPVSLQNLLYCVIFPVVLLEEVFLELIFGQLKFPKKITRGNLYPCLV